MLKATLRYFYVFVLGFQYIIERAQATKVCFGSGKSRTTIFGEVDKFRIGPQTYHCEDYTSGIWQFLNKVSISINLVLLLCYNKSETFPIYSEVVFQKQKLYFFHLL